VGAAEAERHGAEQFVAGRVGGDHELGLGGPVSSAQQLGGVIRVLDEVAVSCVGGQRQPADGEELLRLGAAQNHRPSLSRPAA
jgi:hypothetical protein